MKDVIKQVILLAYVLHVEEMEYWIARHVQPMALLYAHIVEGEAPNNV